MDTTESRAVAALEELAAHVFGPDWRQQLAEHETWGEHSPPDSQEWGAGYVRDYRLVRRTAEALDSLTGASTTS